MRRSAFEDVPRLLRYAALLFVVGGTLQIAASVLGLASPGLLQRQGVPAGAVVVYVGVSFVLATAMTLVALAWIRSTYTYWRNSDPRGYRHARLLAVFFIVVGGLGLAGAFDLRGTWPAATTLDAAYGALNVVALCVSLATFLIGILVLRRRAHPDVRKRFASGTSS